MMKLLGTKLVFFKALWSEDDIELSRCLGFVHNPDEKTVTADILLDRPLAIHEFAKQAFPHKEGTPEWIEAFNELREQYKLLFHNRREHMKRSLPYYDRMYKHQIADIQEMMPKQNVFIAWDMGLGKSISSLSLSLIHKDRCTLIVTINMMKWTWYREMVKKFGFDALQFTVLDSAERRCIRAFLYERYIIVNYEAVAKYHNYITERKPSHIIIDEATKVKGHTTGLWKAINNVRDAVTEKAEGVVPRITFLSGTPVKNRVNDLYAYHKMIGHPIGENYAKFMRDHTHTSMSRGHEKIRGGKALDSLYRKMSNWMFRKTKEECLDLPEKIVTNYYFQLGDYKEEYNKVLAELAEQRNVMDIQKYIHTLNIVVAKSKLPGIIELAESIIESGEKLSIFSSYNEPLNLLATHFGNRAVLINGSVDAKERDNRMQRFQEDETCEVFLGNMIAAGMGINLTNACNIIFVNFPLTPSELEQCIDRHHRIGQAKKVNVALTVAEDSLDEYLLELIGGKAHDIQEVINKGKVASVDYSNIPQDLFKSLIEKLKESAEKAV